MNSITEQLLSVVSDWDGSYKGAYNIREDGGCAGRQSSENIKIEPKSDNPGIVIKISSNDLVYNDFIVEDGADVIIVAGCGVHSEGEEEARHNGIHRFFIGKNAKVIYKEKHIGTGNGKGAKRIDPVTDVEMDENSYMEMDTVQIGGVTSTSRLTTAKLGKDAKLVIRERLMTEGDEKAKSDFKVDMNGDGSSVDLVSRSVARGNSYQEFVSTINAVPGLFAGNIDASLIHEAAIGKIAGEQITKLCTLGLTEEEAERKIIDGFLK